MSSSIGFFIFRISFFSLNSFCSLYNLISFYLKFDLLRKKARFLFGTIILGYVVCRTVNSIDVSIAKLLSSFQFFQLCGFFIFPIIYKVHIAKQRSFCLNYFDLIQLTFMLLLCQLAII